MKMIMIIHQFHNIANRSKRRRLKNQMKIKTTRDKNKKQTIRHIPKIDKKKKPT